jgi:hypothetical protein
MDLQPATSEWNGIRKIIFGSLFIAAVSSVFLAPADLLIGSSRTDIGQQFLAWRAFAAESLRAGHAPLWNPYSYAGEPFLGGFQSALYYPPNLIFLVLPLCRALNLSLVINLFLLGAGAFRWAARRGLHPVAAGLCALALPLSGPVLPHVFAGHLPNLCTLAWAPWVFASLEDWYRGGSRRCLLFASAAVCMQILAGQMQYVFYIAVAVAVHAIAFSFAAPGAWRRTLPAVAGIYVAAAALAAAQLIPGLAATAEGLRGTRLSYAFAGQFSLPPENLLTAVAPGFFGDPIRHLYWGRCYPWEMSVFVGVSGVVLAAVALADPGRRKSAGLFVGIAALLLLPALGHNTPLFGPLYEFMPGFGRFRGWSKFTFPAIVFFTVATGIGADALLRRSLPGKAASLGILAAGFATAAAGLWIWSHPLTIAPVLAWVRDTRESYLSTATFTDPGTIRDAGIHAGRSLAIAGALAFLCGISLALARRRAAWGWVVLGLLPLEMICFAAPQFATFRRAEVDPPELTAFVAAHPGDYRVQNLLEPNNGFLLGKPDMWGDDPGLLARYAQFITFTQGGNPDQATQNVTFRSPSPLYSLLRLRYVLTESGDKVNKYEFPGAMDRVQLVPDYRVLPGRDAIFSAMSQPDFDPRQTVLLESLPGFNSSRGINPGWARVIDSSADCLTVEAEVTTPSLLLVTDAYSRDWRAQPLKGSSQARYDVMPADYTLRATPLAAGHHLIRFEYVPTGLWAGLAISALAWVAWFGLFLLPRCLSPTQVPVPDKPGNGRLK